MNQKKKKWHKWLGAFFTGCILLGSSLAYAAPLLWSYPNDHVLISEVNFLGAPGPGSGVQWVELYNPTNSDKDFGGLEIYQPQGEVAMIPTQTPIPSMTTTPYPFDAGCFIYLTYDASAFYNTYNQCPNYAGSLDTENCPQTQPLIWYSPINSDNNTLCAYTYTPINMPPFIFFTDAMGWGTGGTGQAWSCVPVQNPLPAPPDALGFTYLRGDDAPEWIGPGGEGAEVAGTPVSEQLAEVWHLSSDVNVAWEGPEVGVCRAPTAVTLQNPHIDTAQNSGIILALFGFIGLLTMAAIWNWRQSVSQS